MIEDRDNEINSFFYEEYQKVLDDLDNRSIICGRLFNGEMCAPIRYTKRLNVFFTEEYGILDINIHFYSVQEVNIEDVSSRNNYEGVIACNGLKYGLILSNQSGTIEVEVM